MYKCFDWSSMKLENTPSNLMRQNTFLQWELIQENLTAFNYIWKVLVILHLLHTDHGPLGVLQQLYITTWLNIRLIDLKFTWHNLEYHKSKDLAIKDNDFIFNIKFKYTTYRIAFATKLVIFRQNKLVRLEYI